jgi:hypothetical protein
MGAILIQSDDSLLKLFLELAKKTGAKTTKLNEKSLLEFQTGERLKTEKTNKRVSEEVVLEKLSKKMLK